MQYIPSTKREDQKPNFLLYQTEDGKTRIAVKIEGETVWLKVSLRSLLGE